MTGDGLAQQLYVDPGDVRVILRTLTEEPVSDLAPEASVARSGCSSAGTASAPSCG